MNPTNRVPTHPGEILKREFLGPLGITQRSLAEHIGVPQRLISEVVRRKRPVRASTAWLFALALDTTPEFWLNLQSSYDLARSRPLSEVRSLAQAPASVRGRRRKSANVASGPQTSR